MHGSHTDRRIVSCGNRTTARGNVWQCGSDWFRGKRNRKCGGGGVLPGNVNGQAHARPGCSGWPCTFTPCHQESGLYTNKETTDGPGSPPRPGRSSPWPRDRAHPVSCTESSERPSPPLPRTPFFLRGWKREAHLPYQVPNELPERSPTGTGIHHAPATSIRKERSKSHGSLIKTAALEAKAMLYEPSRGCRQSAEGELSASGPCIAIAASSLHCRVRGPAWRPAPPKLHCTGTIKCSASSNAALHKRSVHWNESTVAPNLGLVQKGFRNRIVQQTYAFNAVSLNSRVGLNSVHTNE